MLKDESVLSALEFRGPRRVDEHFDLYEAIYEAGSNPQDHVYSCVAIYRRGWKGLDWPALGGTRWINAKVKNGQELSQEDTRHAALELAMSMYVKNSVLRKAEAVLRPDASGQLFNWQGGKGVIWTPPGTELTPLRLMCHGRLIEFLHGEYIGSKDQGVGTTGLKWISCATRYTIGLGCLRDTGEATARGVHAGIEATVRRQAEAFGSDSLRGIPILVMGIGKVGYPLVELLHASGAEVYVFDGALKPDEQAVGAWCEAREDKEAPDVRRAAQRSAMAEILHGRRILSSEAEALELPQIRIVSPNGGNTEWLAEPLDGLGARARILAENRRRNHNLRLILGAGNDQVSTTDKGKEGREEVLSLLKDADITFVPDPLVSPGGVIAVSHELAPKWDAEAVNDDARRIVEESVGQVFRQAEKLGGTDAVTMYRAFENMVHQDWI
jgi:glutamate dehydrogenase/leucine dehydrogenase